MDNQEQVKHGFEWREDEERRRAERREQDRRMASKLVDLDHISGPTTVLCELVGVAAALDHLASGTIVNDVSLQVALRRCSATLKRALGTE